MINILSEISSIMDTHQLGLYEDKKSSPKYSDNNSYDPYNDDKLLKKLQEILYWQAEVTRTSASNTSEEHNIVKDLGEKLLQQSLNYCQKSIMFNLILWKLIRYHSKQMLNNILEFPEHRNKFSQYDLLPISDFFESMLSWNGEFNNDSLSDIKQFVVEVQSIFQIGSSTEKIISYLLDELINSLHEVYRIKPILKSPSVPIL